MQESGVRIREGDWIVLNDESVWWEVRSVADRQVTLESMRGATRYRLDWGADETVYARRRSATAVDDLPRRFEVDSITQISLPSEQLFDDAQ